MYGDTTVMRKRADQLREQGVDITQTRTRSWPRPRASTGADGPRRPCGPASTTGPATCGRPPAPTRAPPTRWGGTSPRSTVSRTPSPPPSTARARSCRTPSPGWPRWRPTRTRRGAPHSPEADRTLLAFVPPPAGHKDWLAVDLPGLNGASMTTVDLTTPHAPPGQSPRRTAAAGGADPSRAAARGRRAGNAPLPLDVTESRPGALEDSDGPEPGSTEDAAYLIALATCTSLWTSCHAAGWWPTASSTPAWLVSVGPLATRRPLDLDVRVGDVQAKA